MRPGTYAYRLSTTCECCAASWIGQHDREPFCWFRDVVVVHRHDDVLGWFVRVERQVAVCFCIVAAGKRGATIVSLVMDRDGRGVRATETNVKIGDAVVLVGACRDVQKTDCGRRYVVVEDGDRR